MANLYRIQLVPDPHDFGEFEAKAGNESTACDLVGVSITERAAENHLELDWETLKLSANVFSAEGEPIPPYGFDATSTKMDGDVPTRWTIKRRLRSA